MKKHGKVVRWDSARAFGFIRSPDTPAEIFFHIKDFRGLAAPCQGMPVTFVLAGYLFSPQLQTLLLNK